MERLLNKRGFATLLLAAGLTMFGTGLRADFESNILAKGKLDKYDEKHVWLRMPAGKREQLTKFKRKHFPDLKGFVAGVAVIQAEVPVEELFELNPELFK